MTRWLSSGQEHFPDEFSEIIKNSGGPVGLREVTGENLYQQERTRCSTQFPGSNDLWVYNVKYRVSICLWEGRRGPWEASGAIRLRRYHLMPLNGSEAVLVRLMPPVLPYHASKSV